MEVYFNLVKLGGRPHLVRALVDTSRVDQLIKEGFRIEDSWVVDRDGTYTKN